MPPGFKIEIKDANLVVVHPDFCTTQARIPVGGESLPVVMKRGGTVRLSAEMESGGDAVGRLHAQAGETDQDRWLPTDDGALTNTGVPAGVHAMRMVCFAENGATFFSDAITAEVQVGETRKFHATLSKAIRN